MIEIKEHKKVKNGRGAELGTTENKSSQPLGWGLNSGSQLIEVKRHWAISFNSRTPPPRLRNHGILQG